MTNHKLLSRREFLQVSGATSLGLMLAACGYAQTPTTVPTSTPSSTVTPLPTQTPIPTDTPTPTVTPTATATRVEELKPPEALMGMVIRTFIAAMRYGGISIEYEQVAQGLSITDEKGDGTLLTDRSGTPYIVAVYTIPEGQRLSGMYPLMIAEKKRREKVELERNFSR
jgi:hypothetical protein